ncbi:MAG: NADH-quinone oxidoreductase subunit L [Candidatus Electrothrix sp. GW3-4]|uniref:NADH-quinone oxidoreductase subunit L n=1 Tax=Candidatus Electrothrix sp. GW3-4 TaxID=3126740 RepID=UPI0030CF50AE
MADCIFSHSYLILLCPLLSFILIGLKFLRSDNMFVGKFAITLSAISCGYALLTALTYFVAVMGHGHSLPYPEKIALDGAWLNFSPTLTANMGIYLDPISVMMLVVVTVISFLVNIYSVGYMKGDSSFNRFFALLALFSFSMLGLVVSSNILQMFVFWELVGVSSYALIGFWYEKPSAVAASKKAFIMTRFADAFFLLGILLVSFQAESFSFQTLNSPETAALLNTNFLFAGLSMNLLTLATLLIFCGGWGKSAMFPLHVWLPDAMEGPTPVSSIIHSATMVVAGVYLTARMFPLFAASESTLFIIQCIGAFTALFAAVIAITQMDIKRILAFSTLSQLGYMIFSLGAAKVCAEGGHHESSVNLLGYSAAMYHVFTHAFFKCMLFLGAGAIIHAVHSNDIMKMGGLKSLMPKTYWSLLFACLAIAGVFPFSGFWSKDAILLSALQSGHYITFLVGLVTGGLTAFYMFRFFFLIFHGEARSELHEVHEDPWMTWPIMILTIPTIFAGLLEHFFVANVVPPQLEEVVHFTHPGWLPWLATLAATLGIGGAWLFYKNGKTEAAARLKSIFGPVYIVVYNKFYMDEVWLFITHRIIFAYIAAPIKWFDRHIVDGSMNLTGWLLQVGGKGVRLAQSGQLQFYLGATVIGFIVLLFLG